MGKAKGSLANFFQNLVTHFPHLKNSSAVQNYKTEPVGHESSTQCIKNNIRKSVRCVERGGRK